jgi:hypothetical protein
MLSITIVSILILTFIYRRYERTMLAWVNAIAASNRNLALFMFAILFIPLILLFV